jgi:tungstate transport system ATP-binding protein
MKEPVYQVQGLVKEYGARRALALDYLEIWRGEICALVGPSGAGKSTLLRLLNFLEPPTAGSIYFMGKEFSAARPSMPLAWRRRVTCVAQRPLLLHRTVWDNVRFGLQLRGQRDGRAQVQATLELMGLTAMARQPAASLSGGEAQRVALARAMVLQPDVLLLDEPTANLDPYNVAVIEQAIQTLNREQGTTVVLVTHQIFQARRLAHRVGLLLDGRLIELSEVNTFFERPRDPRTAAFVRGEMVY